MDARRYNDLFLWESLQRTALLGRFRRLVGAYWEKPDRHPTRAVPDRSTIEREANLIVEPVDAAVRAAGIIPCVTVPILGGQPIHVVLDWKHYTSEAIDCTDRAVGVYQADRLRCLVRTLNPFYWLLRLTGVIAGYVFQLLQVAGFNAESIEKGPAGKGIRLGVFLGSVSAVVSILYHLGYLGQAKKWLHLP